jgi:hypothetical protein
MPPLGYHDEDKRLKRSIDDITRNLVRLSARLGHEEDRQRYKNELADRAEAEARRKAARGRERDLRHLVDISVLQDRQGITAWDAAGKIADQIGGDARLRHANHKRLYGKFQKAPMLYRRLAFASEDPADAAEREICEAIGITPRSEWEQQRGAGEQQYRVRLLEWAHEALKQDELARAINAARTFKDVEEFARAYRAVLGVLNSFK